ncbi:uncharacterized protein UV8b_07861 [Ustilaginoidea virens]|uniref:Uncharacterized protein n=1 Tax=Ustilaginoidea virens TaxID=1159556 RepID=A0A8E5HXT1_USTVR|nr:uncharacterized protein UV8b_07861 [Ustilaginoidea virens]QUC23620.1 hypothetical protein UV8b_07861 [Ustilaginoidea virens]
MASIAGGAVADALSGAGMSAPTGANRTTTTTTITTTTPTPSPSPTTQPPLTSVLTTYSMTTYTLPTLTSWGTAPDALGDFNLGDRVLQLVSSGSRGEKIVRGFLMGVALGILLGGALCCWVPCFGRRRRRRRRQRQRRRNVGRTGGPAALGHADGMPTMPVSERSYMRMRWEALSRPRRQ